MTIKYSEKAPLENIKAAKYALTMHKETKYIYTTIMIKNILPIDFYYKPSSFYLTNFPNTSYLHTSNVYYKITIEATLYV